MREFLLHFSQFLFCIHIVLAFVIIDIPHVLVLLLLSSGVAHVGHQGFACLLGVRDLSDGFLLELAQVKHLPNGADKEGDDEGAPEGVDDGDDAPERGHGKDIAIAYSGHSDNHAPHCCLVGVEEQHTLALEVYFFKYSQEIGKPHH